MRTGEKAHKQLVDEKKILSWETEEKLKNNFPQLKL